MESASHDWDRPALSPLAFSDYFAEVESRCGRLLRVGTATWKFKRAAADPHAASRSDLCSHEFRRRSGPGGETDTRGANIPMSGAGRSSR